MSGGSVIVDPWGDVLAGPVRDREEIIYADCDLDRVLHARRVLDTAGHSDRAEIEAAG
jgi:predicted amidohydrolase